VPTGRNPVAKCPGRRFRQVGDWCWTVRIVFSTATGPQTGLGRDKSAHPAVRPEAYLRVSRTDPGRRHSRCKLQTEPRHHRRRSGIDVAVNIFELGRNCTQFGTDFGPVGIDGVRSCFSEMAMARRPHGPRHPAMPDASEEEWLRRRLWDNVLGLFAHPPAKNDLR
jgi:hypothetical protein